MKTVCRSLLCLLGVLILYALPGLAEETPNGSTASASTSDATSNSDKHPQTERTSTSNDVPTPIREAITSADKPQPQGGHNQKEVVTPPPSHDSATNTEKQPPKREQRPKPIEVQVICRDVISIIDRRQPPSDISEFLINGKITSNVCKRSSHDKKQTFYNVMLHEKDMKTCQIILKSKGDIIHEERMEIDEKLDQCLLARPNITHVSPLRILEGGKLIVTGTDLGEKNTDLTLYLRNETPIVSESLTSPEKDKPQTAHFLIPSSVKSPPLYDNKEIWTSEAWFAVQRINNDRCSELSNWNYIGLVKSDAKLWLFLVCLAITIIIIFVIITIIRNSFETSYTLKKTCLLLFFDKQTNTFSLSKLQALGWTIVVLWSYLFFALGRIVLSGDFTIPDLNSSVLELLGISYSGLLTARGVGKSFPKNDLASAQPKLYDLFSENNEISLPRLQLFAFTLVGFVLYLAASLNPDFFTKGLPQIPETLNALFLVSQGGYIGGKLTGASAVNHILPRRITAPFLTPITIYGKNFADKTTILVQGLQDSFAAIFMNQNAVQLSLKDKTLDLGLKQLVIIPPTGSSYALENAIEVIAPKIRKTMRTDSCGHPALEADFIGIVLNGEPLTAQLVTTPPPTQQPGGAAPPIAQPPAAPQDTYPPLAIAHMAGNRYMVTRPGGLTTGDTIRIAATDGSFAFETTVNGTATDGYES